MIHTIVTITTVTAFANLAMAWLAAASGRRSRHAKTVAAIRGTTRCLPGTNRSGDPRFATDWTSRR
jgi:hypothetical protein